MTGGTAGTGAPTARDGSATDGTGAPTTRAGSTTGWTGTASAGGDDAQLVRQWRRDLHRIPELGMAVDRTGDLVAQVLAETGCEVVRGVGGNGIVATLHGDAARSPTAPSSAAAPDSTSGAKPPFGPHRAIGLRADMDALPLTESGDHDHRSEHDGAMHACGHDGHMAMVLGAARALARRGGFAGTVHLVFQPAEEHGLGAAAMLQDGLLERFPMDAMFGLHAMPGMAAGTLATRPGPLMASEDTFEVRIDGRGGHAARPEMVVDPIVVASHVVVALQSVVARNVAPTDTAVVSCTEITSDGARNAIPGTAWIRGDCRSFTPDVRALLERRLREVAAGVAAAHGASAAVTWRHEFWPTVNDPAATALAVAAARDAVGPTRVVDDVAPWTASEDFGRFLDHVPGCFVLLGTGTAEEPGGTPLHAPDFDFNDDVLEVGVAWYRALVQRALPPATGDDLDEHAADRP